MLTKLLLLDWNSSSVTSTELSLPSAGGGNTSICSSLAWSWHSWVTCETVELSCYTIPVWRRTCALWISSAAEWNEWSNCNDSGRLLFVAPTYACLCFLRKYLDINLPLHSLQKQGTLLSILFCFIANIPPAILRYSIGATITISSWQQEKAR